MAASQGPLPISFIIIVNNNNRGKKSNFEKQSIAKISETFYVKYKQHVRVSDSLFLKRLFRRKKITFTAW